MEDKIKQYYRDRVENKDRSDFLWQVGKTVDGVSVPDEQIDLIIENIASKLQLGIKDIVLDIGCANGLLTKKIAGYVTKVTGLELTSELYEVACEYNSHGNIKYINANILDYEIGEGNDKFTKVYLYEVMQHLSYQEADMLFKKLGDITADDVSIFIGGVLDVEKKWNFFDTFERRSRYFTGLLSESDPFGSWYHKDYFNCLALRHNFDSECVSQKNRLYTSHYRFDCVLTRKQN
ncbi:MAG TPA: class I SAM-dependent methyltransferase [Gammaproteobacteria bacterium]|nr:class I SAM-dependent methyltransferase [Gammaproteobacteria bacterium]